MNSNSTSAVATQFPAKPDLPSCDLVPDGVEQARILYLRRRLRIAPQIPAVVAPFVFGATR